MRGRNERQMVLARTPSHYGILTITHLTISLRLNGYTPRCDSLAQAIEAGVQSLADIKLRMRKEPAGVIESGVQTHLHAAALGTLHPGTKQHISLPDLITQFGFKLLVR